MKSFLRNRRANAPNVTKSGIDMMKERAIDEFEADAIRSPDSLSNNFWSDTQLRMEVKG